MPCMCGATDCPSCSPGGPWDDRNPVCPECEDVIVDTEGDLCPGCEADQLGTDEGDDDEAV